MDIDDVRSLTQMMDLAAGTRHHWDPAELGPIFAHQLDTPLVCDLADLDSRLSARLAEFNASGDGTIETFSDLLGHPRPPVDLLELVKRFAKNCRSHADSPLPGEIATVLYFLAIATALLRCEKRITKMDDAALRYSIDWALQQAWLDQSSHTLLEQTRALVGDAKLG